MSRKSPAKAGEAAAERTPEEQKEVLKDAPEATDKQQEELAEAAGNPPAAPDDSAGTPAGEGLAAGDEARAPELGDDVDAPVPAAPEGIAANVVRHADQRVGVVSESALNVSRALELKPNTEWTESLQKAIKGFQESIGQKETGYLTRDQCRRLGLTLLV